VKAGALLDGAGLQASSKGGPREIFGWQRDRHGWPISETKELIAGYWISQVKSRQEAIEWARRAPAPQGEEGEIEIRQFFEIEDFEPSTAINEARKPEQELKKSK
jgi:hypothetical protein